MGRTKTFSIINNVLQYIMMAGNNGSMLSTKKSWSEPLPDNFVNFAKVVSEHAT